MSKMIDNSAAGPDYLPAQILKLVVKGRVMFMVFHIHTIIESYDEMVVSKYLGDIEVFKRETFVCLCVSGPELK